MAPEHRAGVTTRARARFSGSVDLDDHFREAEPDSHRWDYGIGIRTDDGEQAHWIEPHPASSTGEADVMLAKLRWLKAKLADPRFREFSELTPHARSFHWLARTGGIRILPQSRQARALNAAGLGSPRRHLTLPEPRP